MSGRTELIRALESARTSLPTVGEYARDNLIVDLGCGMSPSKYELAEVITSLLEDKVGKFST